MNTTPEIYKHAGLIDRIPPTYLFINETNEFLNFLDIGGKFVGRLGSLALGIAGRGRQ